MRLTLGTDVGGCPQAYPVAYKILALKDGAALKLTDALGRTAEVALSADDARLLALGLLGALPHQSVSGMLGPAANGTQMAAQERAKGVCPECGRTVSGRAIGPEPEAADRRFVALGPHTRGRQGHGRDEQCLTRGARRVVPRVRD